MTSLDLSGARDVSLEGKTAIITGGSSGIGLATAKLFSDRGALVFNIDVQPPTIQQQRPEIEYVKCDQSSWSELLITFKRWPQIDIVVANGGVTEYPNYFDDVFDEQGELEEPCQAVFRVNLIGTINVCKLAMSRMRKQESGGSIVITSSATALMPEHSLPVYGACKAAMLGLVRALRSVSILDKVTINAVAPAATITNQLPQDLATPIIEAGLPVSSAEHVALAILHSATGTHEDMVECYGKDKQEDKMSGRWHGRTVLTLGDTWTEIEGPLVQCREQWFGAENERLTKEQQAMTDSRFTGDRMT